MKVTYDPNADAMYVHLTEEKFSKTKIIDDNTILDLDKNGNPLYLEIIGASERMGKKDFSRITIGKKLFNLPTFA